MKNSYKTGISRLAAVFLAFMMVFSVGSLYAFADDAGNGDAGTSSSESGDNGDTSSAAAADAEVPAQPDDLYVYDEAGVISAETKSAINAKNADLNAKYGVQIVVFTMTTLPGEKSDYDGRAAYLKKVMDTWNIGGDSQSGLIVGLSVSDGDYMTVSGNGLHGAFSGTTLNTLQHENLEADFQAGTYDAGVLKYFNALAAETENYKSGNPTDPTAGDTSNTSSTAESAAAALESGASSSSGAESAASSGAAGDAKGGSVVFGILRVILIIVIIFAVLLLIVYLHGQHVRKKRREARRRRAEQRRRTAPREDINDRPRRDPPKRSAEDDYLDFMNRYK